jgi:hypothetical protein
MFNKFIAISLLCGAAFAGTWRVDGVKTSEALLLDQTLPQTIANGPVDVTGLINQYAINDVGYILASATYAQVFELYGVSDSGSHVDTSAGTFQDQSFTVEIHPYGYTYDWTFVYSYGTYTTLSDFSTTPFQLQLAWSDYGDNGAFQIRGFYVLINDGTSYYWKDVGNVTSLQVSDFIGWEQGTPYSSFNGPYYVPAGSLYSQNYWFVYAKNASGLKTVYSSNYSSAYDYGDYYGWSMSLSWDAVEGATSYIVYNTTAGYWIETTDTSIIDNGDHSYWNYGAPDVSPSSPFIENKDFLGGHNSDVSVKLNGYGQFETTAGTGISPLKVNSPTLNENLNADLLDGQHAYEFQPAGSYQAAGDYVTPTSAPAIIAITALTNLTSSSSRITVSGRPNASIDFIGGDRISLTNNRVNAVIGLDGSVIVSGYYDYPAPLYTSNTVVGTTQGNILYLSSNFMLTQRVYGGAGISWSSDQGTNWTACSGTPSYTPYSVAKSSNYFYAGFGDGRVYRSSDGKSWSAVPCLLAGLSYLTANTNSPTVLGRYAYNSSTIYISNDCGTNFSTAFTSSASLSGSYMSFPPSNHLFVVSNSKVALSRDNGVSWAEVSTGFTPTYTRYSVAKNYLFFLVPPYLYRSTYSGGFTNFTLISSEMGNFFDVSLSGLILQRSSASAYKLSKDDGVSWEVCPYLSGSLYFSVDSLEAFKCDSMRMYKGVFETPISFSLLQSNQGISKTNWWTDASSVTHTQIFNKGVLTLWTKNGI